MLAQSPLRSTTFCEHAAPGRCRPASDLLALVTSGRRNGVRTATRLRTQSQPMVCGGAVRGSRRKLSDPCSRLQT